MVVPLRMPEAEMEVGDMAIHGEQLSGGDIPLATEAPSSSGYDYPSGVAAPAGAMMSMQASAPPTDTR
jgi:hypothetical protein